MGNAAFEADTAEAAKREEGRQNIPVTPETDDILYVMADGAQVNTLVKNADGSTWRENKLGVVFKQKDVKSKNIQHKAYTALLGSALEANKNRINYAEYRAAGYCIGSGSVESGNKTVVHKRLKQAGMRWSPQRAQHMLSLRAKDESGRWPDVATVLSAA